MDGLLLDVLRNKGNDIHHPSSWVVVVIGIAVVVIEIVVVVVVDFVVAVVAGETGLECYLRMRVRQMVMGVGVELWRMKVDGKIMLVIEMEEVGGGN